jgi:hypothetical protein
MNRVFVRDLVEINESAEIRSAVQLSSFHKPENLDLIRSYIFTGRAAVNKKSSAELLNLYCDAFLDGRVENRFAAIATYGHGKSHFALAVANFFGMAMGTPGSEAVLAGLDHALTDRALYGRLAAFKRNHRPFLVLTLRGDEPLDLPTMFFRALQEVLDAEPATHEIALPFWFTQAERFLADLTGERQAQADRYLAQQGMDLATLLGQVRQQDSRALAPFRAVFRELNSGVDPNFAFTTPLGEAVGWVIDELCNKRQIFAGLLILFDEFSAFIERYPAMRREMGSQPLLDLLEGVDRKRKQAVFIAFSQHDPDTIAAAARHESQETLANIEKELNRLPKGQRHLLHSSLEAVLDSFLKQDLTLWDELLEDNAFKSAILRATHDTLTLFGAHYQQELGWDRDQFMQSVVKGCFPLHPLTTTLLAAVDLHKTSSPRTVLGFVREVTEPQFDRPVFDDGQPAWILPTVLVDYFEAMLGDEYRQLYLPAYRKAGGSDADTDQAAVLKALLLRVAADIRIAGTGVRFEQLIAHLAGLTVERADAALKGLAGRGLIRHDPIAQIYTFWEGGNDAEGVERLVTKKRDGLRLNMAILDRINERHKSDLLKPRPVPVKWGSSNDWAAAQVLVSREVLSVNHLRKLESELLCWAADGRERQRGVVLWLLTSNEEDLAWYRATAPRLLQEAFGDRPVPLVAMLPRQPIAYLAEGLLRQEALSQFTTAERRDVGEDQFNWMADTVKNDAHAALQQLFKSTDYVAPPALRSGLDALGTRPLDQLLPEVYRLAYTRGVGNFFDHYGLSSTNLSRAVALVCTLLREGKVQQQDKAITSNAIAKDIVAKILQQQWGLVNGSDGRVVEPTGWVRFGWEELESAFPPGGGSASVEPVLTRLLSPPFGYDWNTLALLFSAWYGRYHRELRVSKSNLLPSLDSVAKKTNGEPNSPKDFLKALGDIRLQRRDRQAIEQTCQEIIARVDNRTTFSADDARDAMRVLGEFAANEQYDPGLRQKAENARNELHKGIQAASAYDEHAATLLGGVETVKLNVVQLCRAFANIARLPLPTIVAATQPLPDVLREYVRVRIEQATERSCQEYARLTDVGDYGGNRDRLIILRRGLAEYKFDYQFQRVDEALTKLENAKNTLLAKQHDDVVRAELRALQTKGRLVDLRESLTRVQAMSFNLEEGQQARDSKEAQLLAEISRLESAARTTIARLDSATSTRDLQKIREALLRQQDTLAESEEAATLEEALTRCDALEAYLSQLEEATAGPFPTPDSITATCAAIERMRDEGNDALSLLHRERATRALEQVQGESERSQAQARAWLRQCEREARNRGQLGIVLDKLQSPHAFLPDDLRDAYEALRQEVQQRLDADVEEQVVRYFRKIADPAKRRACLARLQALVEGKRK